MASRKIKLELEFEIPPDADIGQLEDIVLQAALRGMERALKESDEEAEAPLESPPCPACEKRGPSATA